MSPPHPWSKPALWPHTSCQLTASVCGRCPWKRLTVMETSLASNALLLLCATSLGVVLQPGLPPGAARLWLPLLGRSLRAVLLRICTLWWDGSGDTSFSTSCSSTRVAVSSATSSSPSTSRSWLDTLHGRCLAIPTTPAPHLGPLSRRLTSNSRVNPNFFHRYVIFASAPPTVFRFHNTASQGLRRLPSLSVVSNPEAVLSRWAAFIAKQASYTPSAVFSCLDTRSCVSLSQLWSFVGITMDRGNNRPNRWPDDQETRLLATAV